MSYPHDQQLSVKLYTLISTPVNNLIHDLSPSYQQMWIKHTFRIDIVKTVFTFHTFEYTFAAKKSGIFFRYRNSINIQKHYTKSSMSIKFLPFKSNEAKWSF